MTVLPVTDPAELAMMPAVKQAKPPRVAEPGEQFQLLRCAFEWGCSQPRGLEPDQGLAGSFREWCAGDASDWRLTMGQE